MPSAVIDVSHWNMSSTSVLVSWSPPLNPNGMIMHYTIYGLNLNTDRAFQQLTNSTSALLTGRVTLSTRTSPAGCDLRDRMSEMKNGDICRRPVY